MWREDRKEGCLRNKNFALPHFSGTEKLSPGQYYSGIRPDEGLGKLRVSYFMAATIAAVPPVLIGLSVFSIAITGFLKWKAL
jgi:hypothetical protein